MDTVTGILRRGSIRALATIPACMAVPQAMTRIFVIYTHGGPEIAVASTKAYTVQIAALYLLFCRMALIRGVYTEEHAEQFMSDLLNCATSMETMIREENTINEIVTHNVNYPDVFFIGRGMDYAFSLEGALKLKEISYIHAEAYAAGELKHGTIALITDHVPVIAIATQKHIFAKTISNIREVKARGAYVILLVTESQAKDLMIKTDKKRSSYYNYYSSKRWGDSKSYDLCMNSSKIGYDGVVKMIQEFAKIKGAYKK